MEEKEIWHSSKSASDYLGLTGRTLYKLINDGKITAYKFGRVIRVKQSDLDAFITSQQIQPGGLSHLLPHVEAAADRGFKK